MRYFKYANTDKNLNNAFKEQYKALTEDEKRTFRKKKTWERTAVGCFLAIFILFITAGTYFIKLIPQPEWWLSKLLAGIAGFFIFVTFLIVSGLMAYGLTSPLWKKAASFEEKGIYVDSSFMDEIEEMITDLVKNYKIIEDAEVLMHPALEEIGTCPCCGRHVVEKQKGYFCEDRGCSFVLWKQNRFFEALGKKMTKQTASKLLHDGKVELKGCKSQKTGKTYDTTVVMSVDENKRAVFQLSFEKGEGKNGKSKNKKN